MGNICRSPLLEGLARDRLAAAGLAHVQVASAGTGDWHRGQSPDPRAITAAAELGVDISGQSARGLAFSDFNSYDQLLCADRDNLAEVLRRAPRAAKSRVALALDWCGVKASGEVPDPYYGSAADFRAVARLAAACADGLLHRLGVQA